MLGRDVFKHAVNELSEAVEAAFRETGIRKNQVKAVFAHQANIRIINAVLERTGIPSEKAYNNIDKYGNTSAASIPILIDEYNKSYGLREGALYLILSFGAGLVWGIHLYEHRKG
jgi:3-oxoacyl-[acyl-carrier-protein] synthase-3